MSYGNKDQNLQSAFLLGHLKGDKPENADAAGEVGDYADPVSLSEKKPSIAPS